MKPARSLILLEVVVGLALLGMLGVWLIQLQTASLRQTQDALLMESAVAEIEQLLGEWSMQRVPVTLPAHGEFASGLVWTRAAEPVRIASELYATQVRLTVEHRDRRTRPVVSIAWLVPRPEAKPRSSPPVSP